MREVISESAVIDHGQTDRLLVVFSCRIAYLADTFDFSGMCSRLPFTKLFLRDTDEFLTYHGGLAGLSEDIESTTDFLRYAIARIGAKRVTFLGASSGGFAAGLFGHLVGVDDIHVVSPVTYVDVETRDRLGGGERFQGCFQRIVDFRAARGQPVRHTDLRPVIRDNAHNVRVMRAHFPLDEPIDQIHADNIGGFDHVQLIPCPGNVHGPLSRALIDDGSLPGDLSLPVEQLLTELPEPGTRGLLQRHLARQRFAFR